MPRGCNYTYLALSKSVVILRVTEFLEMRGANQGRIKAYQNSFKCTKVRSKSNPLKLTRCISGTIQFPAQNRCIKISTGDQVRESVEKVLPAAIPLFYLHQKFSTSNGAIPGPIPERLIGSSL